MVLPFRNLIPIEDGPVSTTRSEVINVLVKVFVGVTPIECVETELPGQNKPLSCLASSVGYSFSRSDACNSLMCAGGLGSSPGTDKLDSGFHSVGV